MGGVLFVSKSVLFMLASEVVVVMVTKGGSCRLPNLPLPPSFRGVNTIEDVRSVDPASDHRLMRASSVHMAARVLRCMAGWRHSPVPQSRALDLER